MANDSTELLLQGSESDIVGALPNDPYQVLQISHRIAIFSLNNVVSKHDAEKTKLQSLVSEKEDIIRSLHDKISSLEKNLTETSDRLSLTLEEQEKLSEENNYLSLTVKKLSREVTKLEGFKKTLLHSLQEEDANQHSQAIKNAEKVLETKTTELLTKGEDNNQSSAVSDNNPSSAVSDNMDTGAGLVKVKSANLVEENQKPISTPGEKYALARPNSVVAPRSASSAINEATPPISPPRRGAPLSISSGGSSRNISPPRSPPAPRWHSSASMSPTRRHSMSLTSSDRKHMYNSYQATGPNSPPHPGSRGPKVDGKEFFRQARSRLSFEQFGAFLANVKELNSHRQSKEETLRKAEEIFGPQNKDLHVIFDNLLSRH